MDIKFILSELSRQGLTQAAIAKEIGCAQSTISDMAAGRAGVKRPSYKLMSGLQALAAKQDIPVDPPRRRKTDK